MQAERTPTRWLAWRGLILFLKHMAILAAILGEIQSRKLDDYFQLEENVQKQSKTHVLEVIKGGDKGSQPLDKLRLFIIWFLSTEQDVTRPEWTQFEDALVAASCDTTCLPYIRQYVASFQPTLGLFPSSAECF
jgi:sec1 family domain-containing protein 1